MSSFERVSTQSSDLRKIQGELVLQPVDGISRTTRQDLDEIISSEITSLRYDGQRISFGSSGRKVEIESRSETTRMRVGGGEGSDGGIVEAAQRENGEIERTHGFLGIVEERFGGILNSSGSLSFGTGSVDSRSSLSTVTSPERILRDSTKIKSGQKLARDSSEEREGGRGRCRRTTERGKVIGRIVGRQGWKIRGRGAGAEKFEWQSAETGEGRERGTHLVEDENVGSSLWN